MIDIEKYRHYLDGHDLTHEEKTEYLQCLADLMQRFVVMAFEAEHGRDS